MCLLSRPLVVGVGRGGIRSSVYVGRGRGNDVFERLVGGQVEGVEGLVVW